MKVPAKIVIMSHLSDLHNFDGKAKAIRIEFIKYLVLNYPDTREEIDPDIEYQKFLDSQAERRKG